MKKRIIAALLAIVMAFSLVACGGGSGASAPAASSGAAASTGGAAATTDDGKIPAWKGALMFASAQTALNLSVTAYLEYIAEGLNGEIQVVEYQGDEGQINHCQNLCNAGVDFIISENPTAATIETMANICDENEVYLTFIHARLLPEEHAPVVDSEYFLGYVWQDEHEAGRGMANALIDAGFKKFIYETCAVGTSIANDYRIEGVLEVIEERKGEGVEVLGSVQVPGGGDWTMSAQNLLSANPDTDAFICSGGGLSCCIQPMREAGKLGNIGFATVDFDDYDTTLESLQEEWATALYGGHFVDGCFAFVLCMNALTGHRLADEPLYDVGMKYVEMDTPENYEKYMQYFENFERPCYDIEEIKEMLCVYNPDFDLEAYAKVLEDYSLDSVFARRGV